MAETGPTMISFGAKLAQNARMRPDRPAISCGATTLTYAELHRRSNRLARGLAAHGVRQGDLVSVALPNSIAFAEVCQAIWKLGATPQPVSFRLPRAELDAIVTLANARLVIGEPTEGDKRGFTTIAEIEAASEDDSDLPDAIAPIAKAPTSGGSTGRPKLILSGGPGVSAEISPEAGGEFLLGSESIVVLPGPLYHNAPFVMMMIGQAFGAHIVLLPRFDAEGTLRAVERHRANWLLLVPTMMNRIWRLPPEVRDGFDLSSLRIAWHMAAPCPEWLKETFIRWLDQAVIMELYGGTEALSATIISGDEWLAHRGSVGRVERGEMKIVGEDGRELPPGEIGEIYMRTKPGGAPTYRYLGAEAKRLPDGWESLGDMGSFDADGYLYLADRRTDMILVGGANVYPAEIEAALEEHPAVQSCAVIGLPDDDLGARIHAIVQRRDDVSEATLAGHLSGRLVTYKLPRSFEFVDEPLRDDAGKVRRSALREARLRA